MFEYLVVLSLGSGGYVVLNLWFVGWCVFGLLFWLLLDLCYVSLNWFVVRLFVWWLFVNSVAYINFYLFVFVNVMVSCLNLWFLFGCCYFDALRSGFALIVFDCLWLVVCGFVIWGFVVRYA